ncbi:MAG: DUF3015 family protein [Elusimicrobiota bacterium]
MRRLGLVVALALAIPTFASAGVHNMAGCGLGAMVFDQNEKGPQIVAVTLNAVGSQTIGITIGTSGCTKSGKVVKGMETMAFAETNFPSLKRDMASGQGQYLDSFASLYGYKTAEQKAEFCKWVQARYETLVPTPETTAVEMLQRLESELPRQS